MFQKRITTYRLTGLLETLHPRCFHEALRILVTIGKTINPDSRPGKTMLSPNFKFQLHTILKVVVLVVVDQTCACCSNGSTRERMLSLGSIVFFSHSSITVFFLNKNVTCISQFLTFSSSSKPSVRMGAWSKGSQAEGRQRRRAWAHLTDTEAARRQLHKGLTSISSSLS